MKVFFYKRISQNYIWIIIPNIAYIIIWNKKIYVMYIVCNCNVLNITCINEFEYLVRLPDTAIVNIHVCLECQSWRPIYVQIQFFTHPLDTNVSLFHQLKKMELHLRCKAESGDEIVKEIQLKHTIFLLRKKNTPYLILPYIRLFSQ